MDTDYLNFCNSIVQYFWYGAMVHQMAQEMDLWHSVMVYNTWVTLTQVQINRLVLVTATIIILLHMILKKFQF